MDDDDDSGADEDDANGDDDDDNGDDNDNEDDNGKFGQPKQFLNIMIVTAKNCVSTATNPET